MRSRMLMISAGAALVSACETTPVDPGFGEAVRYDMAIQTINPDPVYPPGSAQPGSLGTVGAAAAERYRKGTVKAVEKVGTTSSSTGSSGPN